MRKWEKIRTMKPKDGPGLVTHSPHGLEFPECFAMTMDVGRSKLRKEKAWAEVTVWVWCARAWGCCRIVQACAKTTSKGSRRVFLVF